MNGKNNIAANNERQGYTMNNTATTVTSTTHTATANNVATVTSDLLLFVTREVMQHVASSPEAWRHLSGSHMEAMANGRYFPVEAWNYLSDAQKNHLKIRYTIFTEALQDLQAEFNTPELSISDFLKFIPIASMACIKTTDRKALLKSLLSIMVANGQYNDSGSHWSVVKALKQGRKFHRSFDVHVAALSIPASVNQRNNSEIVLFKTEEDSKTAA